MLIGFAGGVAFWGGYNWTMELSNDESFCISCHEMRDNVYQEYLKTPHAKNPSGVKVSCADCHVPKQWIHKFIRKITATNELFHKVAGTINSREKFIANREKMALNVWRSMKATDSRECRNCHDFAVMDIKKQKKVAKKKHPGAKKENQTCIECHKGIAHELPEGWGPNSPLPEDKKSAG